MIGGLTAAAAPVRMALPSSAALADDVTMEVRPAVQQAVDAIKRGRTSGTVALPDGRHAVRRPVRIAGDFSGGITVRSNGSEMVGGDVAIFQLGSLADPGPEYRLNARIGGVNLTGPGKSAANAVGVSIDETADVFLTDGTYRLFRHAIRSTGGLIWDAYNLTLRESGYGLYATETANFAPNSINLYSTRIIKNDRAVFTQANPNGVFTFWGGEIEGNNESGGDRDGRKVVEHRSAGSINYIGAHFEANRGQYNLHYSGADATKNLMMLGCQVIAGAAEQVHIETGRGSFIASRITASGKLGIVFGTAGSGTVIDCEADISGPGVGNVVALRNGRLAFGANPTSVEPLILATAAAVREARGIVARWHGDTVRLQFCNAEGRANGHLQTSTRDHDLHNGNSAGGWTISTGNGTLIHVGRGGEQAIEGGSPGAVLCGTAARPWAGGYTQTAFRVTSDRRVKRDIRPLSERERAVALRCKGLLRAFRLTAEHARDGDRARTHYGVIAQDVIAAFAAEGLDALATGVVQLDRWTPDGRNASDHGIEHPNETYSVNYEQLTALLISAL